MKFVFLSKKMGFSGGRKLLFEYAAYLRDKGHDVVLLVLKIEGILSNMLEAIQVDDFSPASIPSCDIIVATTPKDVLKAWRSQKGKTVHFCQGFQITDLEHRIDGRVIPPRFLGNGLATKLNLMRKKLSWWKKLKRIEKIYRLPIPKIVVSEHLKDELEKRFGGNIFVCRNGIHHEFFYPRKDYIYSKFSLEKPIKIVNVGPYEGSFKGIPITIKAVREAKKMGIPMHFTRVSTSASERDIDLVDENYFLLSQEELGKVLRSCDLFISNSTEAEGFGLPAMEALSCGLITILSNISTYRNFSKDKGYCIFVPQNDYKATVDAIKKVFRMSKNEMAQIRSKAIKVASAFSHDDSCSKFRDLLIRIITL
ncbi:MAG: glycosyltransferase family 4 protein [Deltaproteobacteria bacterium]|nr:glycosyltransferase family 4 protein [Deltaproteobacteria bacterium]